MKGRAPADSSDRCGPGRMRVVLGVRTFQAAGEGALCFNILSNI
jgi:hypothetical protein